MKEVEGTDVGRVEANDEEKKKEEKELAERQSNFRG